MTGDSGMKAEDMPTPETDAAQFDVEYETSSDYTFAAWRLARSLEQRLAVQTATAQSLRLLVERAVEYAQHKKGCATKATVPATGPQDINFWPVCDCGLDAFLAEIGARSAAAIQERKDE